MEAATASSGELDVRVEAPRFRASSIRQRCLRSVAAVAALTWLAITLGMVWFAGWETDEMFDNSLREVAHNVLAFSGHELAEIAAEGGASAHDDVVDSNGGTLVYQVWRPGRVPAYRSLNAPDAPLSAVDQGFSEVEANGVRMRTYTTWNKDRTFQVQMAAFPERREAYAARMSAGLCLAMLAALAVFLWLLQRQLDHAFAPLNETVAELSQKSVGDLSPIDTEGLSVELVPMVIAFNGLLSRVSQSVLHVQRFTHDAAHELRTPLAALQILVRNAQRIDDDRLRAEALSQMHSVIERSTLLVNQMLALARYDREPSGLDLEEPVDPAELAREALRAFDALVRDKSLHAEFRDQSGGACLRGNRHALALALRNLFENALTWAPLNGRVLIEVMEIPGRRGIEIRVHDDGPGISPALNARVFDRFYRSSDRASSGAGLGLPTARRIADIHGGSVCLAKSTVLPGAVAILSLPGRE